MLAVTSAAPSILIQQVKQWRKVQENTARCSKQMAEVSTVQQAKEGSKLKQ